MVIFICEIKSVSKQDVLILIIYQGQESIPVGCVPSVAVSGEGGGGAVCLGDVHPPPVGRQTLVKTLW